jgi:hypothetical protein
MNNRRSCVAWGLFLFAAAGSGCGSNPYSGDMTESVPDAAANSTGGAGGSSGGLATAGAGGSAGTVATAPGTGGAVANPGAGGVVTPDAAVGGASGTGYQIALAPIRKLDLVFMLDNSPSMGPKVAKLNAQLPRLLTALKSPMDGTFPDLRVAFIDSDLGTGGAYSSGSCGPNDSNGQNAYGDMGNFQMRGAAACGMTRADSLWLEYTKGAPVNYAGDINKVLSCLAANLGTVGCGEEHALQAFEFALVAQNLHFDQYATQNAFLRPEANLGLVFLSDEDDCSAATNDGMFGDKAELRGESASLRCATRGHSCAGINLSDGGPGYPTKQAFTSTFAACSARTDACQNATDGARTGTDTSAPTTCSPLKSIKTMTKELKGLKGEQGSDKVLVAGIFGWPLAGADGKPDFSKAEPYRIDLVPNPNSADTAHPQVYDYWPLCYDPDHRPKADGVFDSAAWGWGAEGGLRHSAFVDEFGDNGLKYSICERDFTSAMSGIGNALARKMEQVCVPSDMEQGKICVARYLFPAVDPTTSAPTLVADSTPLPKCQDGATVTADCWTLAVDPSFCPGNQAVVQVKRTPAEMSTGPLAEGIKLSISCQ